MSTGAEIVEYIRDCLDKAGFEIEAGITLFFGAFNPSLGDVGSVAVLGSEVDPQLITSITSAVSHAYFRAVPSAGGTDE